MFEPVERLVEKVEYLANRRDFLGRMAAASAALVTALFGFASKSEAIVSWACCGLCVTPLNPPVCEGCVCTWAWLCCDNGRRRICGECYGPGGTCAGGCGAVYCSYSWITGQSC